MYQLPPLPYEYTALEPTVSETTMRTHHDKHHQKYIDNVNGMLAGKTFPPLEELVREAFATKQTKLANNAGQIWNHGFFWESMAPQPGAPDAGLAAAIDAFGGIDAVKKAFIDEGVGHFGSGWVWLAVNSGKLEVFSTHDGDTAITRDGVTPLLVCDLWEHAYYLDYKQDRPGFLEKWWSNVANWAFASRQFAAAQGQGQGYRYPAPQAKAA
jgi:Fe-Mn family superoxide dismutase